MSYVNEVNYLLPYCRERTIRFRHLAHVDNMCQANVPLGYSESPSMSFDTAIISISRHVPIQNNSLFSSIVP